MTNKNKALIIVLLVLVVIIGVVYFINKKKVNVVITPNADSTPSYLLAEKGEVCYYKQTVGEQSTDNSFTSINYDGNGEVHGIINWIPGEKDSLVGAYAGIVENNEGMPGYPRRLNVIYAGVGEGILSYQQEVIIVGENDIKTGIGERYLDQTSTYRFRNLGSLVYGNALPKVDCASVPEQFKADYSISK